MVMRSKKEKIAALEEISRRLEERYPTAECALEYEGDPWKLLVMGRLSAQCTDARVNLVCKELFAKYPTFYEMAEGNLSEIEKIVKPISKDKHTYIYSHSLGSTVALLYMMKYPCSVSKAVLSSPMICGNMGMPTAVAGAVAKALCGIGGKKIGAPGRCVFDKNYREQLRQDEKKLVDGKGAARIAMTLLAKQQ